MDRSDLANAILFEDRFRLERRGLFRLDQAGKAEPVALGSRALDLLRLLAERQGELLSKDLIMEMVWPGAAVEESNLSVQIQFALCDSSKTVPWLWAPPSAVVP